MNSQSIIENVYSVGAVDWHRKLFDAFIPLPHGTSYNSYLIKGSEKTVLIDTVDFDKWDILENNLDKLAVDKIDYVVSNHSEQDHSGCLPKILQKYPKARIVTNGKGKDFLLDLLPLSEENFLLVNNQDTLSLGNKTLRFISAPWVHWPETMLTLLEEDKILFSCDLFGSHLATSDLLVKDVHTVYTEAKRYYAQIMMPFAKSIQKYLQMIEGLEAKFIAPSHGPVYDDPDFIIKAYKEWTAAQPKDKVTILYISMHGSTEKMVDFLTASLIEKNIAVERFNLSAADSGEIAMSVIDSASIIFASSAFLVGPHPNMVHAAYLVNLLKPKALFSAIIGSYGWGNKLESILLEMLKGLKVEFLPSVLVKGDPKNSDFALLTQLSDQISEKHKSIDFE